MKHSLLFFSFLALASLLKAQVSIQANIPKVIAPNAEFTFEVKINKGSVSNFAKYQIDVPSGVTLSEGETKTGSFSFENSRGKIIWVAIPTEAEFVVTIRLNAGSASGIGTINQKFYFLENGSKKEVEAEPITVSFSGSGNAAAKAEPAALVTNAEPPASSPPVASDNAIKQEEPAAAAPSKPAEPEPATPVAETPKEPAKPAAEPKPTPAANAAVIYKVQIGAYGDNPGKAKYKALADVAIVKEGDFYKVLAGNFKNREDALKRKAELQAKGFNGFVVAYQNGQRVK